MSESPARSPAPAEPLTPDQLEALVLEANHAALVSTVARGLGHGLANAAQIVEFSGHRPRGLPVAVDELRALESVLRRVARAAEVAPGPLIVADVIAELEECQRFQVDLPDAALRVQIERGLPAARVEARALFESLFTLVTNAKEAVAGRGGTEIRVAVRAAGGAIRVELEDDGPGVPEGDAERIFAPFYTTRAESGHLGVGLTAARLLLARDGAGVTLDPVRDGRGARFLVHLPVWGAGPA